MKQDRAKNEMEAIQFMIHQRLRANPIESLEQHPDEDTICAFMEGHLEEPGASEMVSHLIACGSCRRTTAQLSRDSEESDEIEAPVDEAGPSRLREMLEGLASKILPGHQEDVVFAYQDPSDENSNKQNEAKTSNDKEIEEAN